MRLVRVWNRIVGLRPLDRIALAGAAGGGRAEAAAEEDAGLETRRA